MQIIKKFHSIEYFETERLIAKKITPDDLDKFISMHINAEVMATLGGMRSLKQTEQNLAWNLDQWQTNGFGLWLFFLKSTGDWIGRGGLRRVMLLDQPEVEIAYALMPAFWQQGYATEIARACIEIAFEVLRLPNVVCFTIPANQKSQRVMQKVGLQYERDLVIEYEQPVPHVIYRMQNYRKAELVPYDPNWLEQFRVEAEKISAALGELLAQIHHVGSTSIENMPAKPVIDMILECEDLSVIEQIKNKLQALKYPYFNRQIIPHRSYFTRKETPTISFHLHIYERGDPQIKRHVNFRDYLRAHKESAQEYAQLKRDLSLRFKDDMYNYVLGKDKFVQSIDQKAKRSPVKKSDYLSAQTTAPASGDRYLRESIDANFNVFLTYFAQYLDQIELTRVPSYTLINTGLKNANLNAALNVLVTNADAAQVIDNIKFYFQKQNLAFSFWYNAEQQAAILPSLLIAKGFHLAETYIAECIDLEKQFITDKTVQLTFKRAKTLADFNDFASVGLFDESIASYFSWISHVLTNDDPIEFYVAYRDRKAVACAAICFYARLAGVHLFQSQSDDDESLFDEFLWQRARELKYELGFKFVPHQNKITTRNKAQMFTSFQQFKLE